MSHKFSTPWHPSKKQDIKEGLDVHDVSEEDVPDVEDMNTDDGMFDVDDNPTQDTEVENTNLDHDPWDYEQTFDLFGRVVMT